MSDSATAQVSSVARALELVELVATGSVEGVTLSELAKAVGGSKSAVLATLRTLVDYGYLQSVEPGPKYLPGKTLVRLGELAAWRE